MNKQSIKHIGILEPTVAKSESAGEQVSRRMPIKSIGETETRGGGIFYRRRKLTKRFIKTPKRRAHSRKVVRPPKGEVYFTIVIGPPSYAKYMGLAEEVMKARKPAVKNLANFPYVPGMLDEIRKHISDAEAAK